MTSTVTMSKGRTRLTPERVEKLEDEAATLLAKARAVFAPRDAGRDEWLVSGRLLHAHVGKRTTAGVRKADAINTAARSLGVLPQRVHELIRIAVVTEALSQGTGAGKLAYNSLRFFGHLWNSKVGRMKDCDPTESREIFAKAAEEGWTAAEVQKAVWGLAKRKKFSRRVVTSGGQTYVCNGREILPSVEGGSDGTSGDDQATPLPQGPVAKKTPWAVSGKAPTVATIATASTPKDLADLLLEVIRQSLDPALVARLVGEGLAEAGKGKAPEQRTFVGFRGDSKAEGYAEDD